MSRLLLKLDSVELTFGRTDLLSGAEMVVAEGDRACLVGRNGSGKSTLLKIAAGIVQPDQGNRFVHPSARVAYLPQEADFTGFDTTSDYVMADLTPLDDGRRAQRLLEDLGLSGYEDPSSLSGGESRRVALARVIAAEPDVLLLDEPTNHLDLPAIEWLEAKLKGLRSAIVLISHDRRFLENLSKSTLWLDRGQVRHLDQGFAHFEPWRDNVLETEEADRHKLDRKIAREVQWMHGGVTGRRKRNVRRVAELAAMRQTKREARPQTGNVVLDAQEAMPAGKIVAEAKGISKSYDGTAIVKNLSVRIARGDRVGIVGSNGAGKTTLLKMLTGSLAPDSGEIRIGTNLEMLMLDQKREDLNPEWTLADALTGGRGDQVTVNGQVRHVVGYMRDFLFEAEQARTPVNVLSGGERARLLLARGLAKPSNLLVLDEPTNDLDLETLDLLQEMLAAYQGTVLLVSHDRDFLDRVVTSVIAAEGNGEWTEYAGGFSDMQMQRRSTEMPGTKTKSGANKRGGDPAGGSTLAPSSPSAKSSGVPKRKLTFKEKHALETLPKTIEKLNADAERIQVQLDDPALYARDRAKFESLSAEAGKLRQALAAAEDQWLELEMLKGESEG
jgi:ABC transport system ATP-binding/permease protein